MTQLRKEIKPFTLYVLTINSILGTGIFFLPAIGAQYAGPASLISWIIISIVSIFLALYFAELVSMFPKAGGTYEFAKHSFGEKTSFLVGWMNWIFANISMSMLIVGALLYIYPGAPFIQNALIAVSFILFFNYINYRGIESSAKMLLIFGVITLFTILSLIFPGLLHFNPQNLSPFFVFPLSGIFIATYFIIETFFGLEATTQLSEETKDATKVLPKVLIWSTVTIALLGIFLAFSGMNVLGWQTFSQSQVPMKTLSESLFGNWSVMITILAFISIMGSAAGAIVSTPRLLFAMARDNLFIKNVEKIHPKYRTPYIAILLQTVVACVVTVFAFADYMTMLSLYMPLIIIVYLFVMLSIYKLRNKNIKRYYTAPFKSIAPLLIILFLVYLLYVWFTETGSYYLIGLDILLILSGIPAYIIIKLQTDRRFVEKFFDRLHSVMNSYWRILYTNKDRERLIKLADLKPNQTILDYGCGCGLTTFAVANKVKKLVAADLSIKQMEITLSKVKKKYVLDDSNVIMIKLSKVAPFKPNTFDRIISVLAINYFVHHREILIGLRRSLKKNGKVIMIAMLAPFIITHPFMKNDDDIKELFSKSGFRKINVERRKGFMHEMIYIAAFK